jgi:hypothetical protein
MAIARRPETIVALRARHEALRIAEAVFRGPGVDLDQLNCHTCGTELDWKHAVEQVAIDCPSCGAVNELPCHLRYRVPPVEQEVELGYASIEPDRRQWWNNAVLPVAMQVEQITAKPSPAWLKVFCLTCLAIVLASLALMAMSTRF